MTAELETILERHRRDLLQLLQILIELQARDGWLPLPHPSPRNTLWLKKNP